jgi:hypothetical protein
MEIPQEHKDTLTKFTSEHNGKPLDPKSLLKANVMVAKILIARFMSMTPEQQQAIKSIVTPDTADALHVLLPELKSLIDKGVKNAAG